MKTFNSLKEIQKYYNENTNTYEFLENGSVFDIKLDFNLHVSSNILARNVYAYHMEVGNINVYDMIGGNIDAGDIDARNLDVGHINAGNIKARNIEACVINARNIKAHNIDATDINAIKISYFAVCFAHKKIKCKSIKGRRNNSKHFCLDGEITYKKQHVIIIDDKEIKLSEESYNNLKKQLK